MKRSSKAIRWGISAAVVLMANPPAFAQNQDPDKITEHDKQVFKDFVGTVDKIEDAKRQKARHVAAINNLRQIGIALFEFETEYGSFPDETTAKAVREATETKDDVKASTANDCFYQLIVSGIIGTDRLFSIEAPTKEVPENQKRMDHLEKCWFSYLIGMNGAGNPSRPLAVAPLVNGKGVFDPTILGGKAVVLCVDNSVRSFPIEKDGRVMINGMDIFDPAQPFWVGKVPPIRWPEE